MVAHEGARLSRSEHIREETRRAAEYGEVPRSPISFAPKFRVARSTPALVAPVSSLVPSAEVARANDDDFDIGTSQDMPADQRGGLEALAPRDVVALREVVAAQLKGLRPDGRAQLLPRLVAAVNALALTGEGALAAQDLRRELSRRVLGEDFPDLEGYTGGARPPSE